MLVVLKFGEIILKSSLSLKISQSMCHQGLSKLVHCPEIVLGILLRIFFFTLDLLSKLFALLIPAFDPLYILSLILYFSMIVILNMISLMDLYW